MRGAIDLLERNDIIAFVIGFTLIVSIFYAWRQGRRYREQYAMRFWPGACAIGFLWDSLFILFAIMNNFPDFPYQTVCIWSILTVTCICVIILWIYNIRKLNSFPQAIVLFVRQILASPGAALALIGLPLLIYNAIQSKSDYYKENRHKTGHRIGYHRTSPNPWRNDS